MISKYINDYIEKHKTEPEKIKKFSKFIEKFFLELEPEDIDIKDAFIEDIEEFMSGVSVENVKKIIQPLKHRDGSTSGEKWSFEEVKQLALQYDVKNKVAAYNKDYCDEFFWFTINYVYATHYNISRTIAGYLELAIDEYCNKNMCMKKYIISKIKELTEAI